MDNIQNLPLTGQSMAYTAIINVGRNACDDDVKLKARE